MQADLLQRPQLGDIGLRIRHDGAFGQLQFQPVRGEFGVLQEADDPIGQVDLVELQWRYVHADAKRPDTQGIPVEAVAGDFCHHPLAQLDDLSGALRDGDELQRGDHAALGVFPAHQCLHAHHFAGMHVNLGLVAQLQLIVAQGIAQLLFHLELLHRPGIHLLIVKTVAGPALGLGDVHGGVGVAHQGVGVLAVVGEDGDADAGGDHRVVRLQGDRLGEGGENPAGHTLDVHGVLYIRQNDGEFIAAEAGDLGADGVIILIVLGQVVDGIIFAQLHGQAFGDFHQQAVAAAVAYGVVDAFEVVEVDEHQRGVGVAALAALEDTAELFVEAAAIGEAGEGVVVGKVAQPVLLPLECVEGIAGAQHILHIAPQQ